MTVADSLAIASSINFAYSHWDDLAVWGSWESQKKRDPCIGGGHTFHDI